MAKPNKELARPLTSSERILVSQGSALLELSETPGYRDFLKPWLEKKFANAWLDPTDLGEDEFKWKYLQNYYYARACQDVLAYIDSAVTQSNELLKIEKGEVEPNAFRDIT